MRQTFRTMLVAAAVAAVGCGDRNSVTNPDANPSLDSRGDFRVAVSSGTTPTFSWSVGAASVLTVIDLTGRTQWALWPDVVDSTNHIGSPIVYGSRPSGTETSTDGDARGLVRGRHYVVTVERSDRTFGQQEFVP